MNEQPVDERPVQADHILTAYKARQDEIRSCPSCGSDNGCQTHGTLPKGPFKREIAKVTDDGGKVFVDEITNPENDPFYLRPEEPTRDESRPAFDYVLEWVCTKIINGVNWVRSFYYAGKSVIGYYKYGLVTFETYRLRWTTGCGSCEYRGKDVETGRQYCRYDDVSCGCPKWVDLFKKLKLKKFTCPAHKFPVGNITILTIKKKQSEEVSD